jgi:hypothetical protein
MADVVEHRPDRNSISRGNPPNRRVQFPITLTTIQQLGCCGGANVFKRVCRAGSEVGGGPETTADSSQASRLMPVWRGGAEFQTSGLATNETRHVNTRAVDRRYRFRLPAVIAPEYSLAVLKSRQPLFECLQVAWYREAVESSLGSRLQRRGTPQRPVPAQPYR